MNLSPQAIVACNACLTLLQLVAIAFTVIRLAHRRRTDRMWWDDWTACPPLLFDIVYLAIMWVRVAKTASSSQTKAEVILFSTFFNVFVFRSVVWLSRVSLALGIARIFPPKHRCRSFAFTLSAVFLCAYIVNTTTTALFPAGPPVSSCPSQNKQCQKAAVRYWIGNLTSLILDAFADVVLVVSPLVMLWKIKLPRYQRRLILALFSSSILSFLSSLAFVLVWMFSPQLGLNSLLAIRLCAHLQALISLLVCNLLVVSMLFYRIFCRETLPNPSPTLESSYVPDSPEERSKREVERSPPSAHLPRITHSQKQAQYTANSSIAFTSVYDDSPMSSALSPAPHTLSFDSKDPTWSSPSFGSSSQIPRWSFPE